MLGPISIILSIATAIQSVVGFGLAMTAVPLLMLVGVDLVSAVFLVLSISLCSSLFALVTLKHEVPFKKSAAAAVIRMLGVVPGYALAVATSATSPTTVKAAIGFTIGLGVLAQALKRQRLEKSADTEALHRPPSGRLAPPAFLTSGVLLGWLGMGGPPLVFWLLTGRQHPKVFRSFLYGVYSLTIPFQLVVMAVHRPQTPIWCLPYLAVSIPLCLAVTWGALKIGNRLNVDLLHRLSLTLLGFLSFKALLEWYWSLRA